MRLYAQVMFYLSVINWVNEIQSVVIRTQTKNTIKSNLISF